MIRPYQIRAEVVSMRECVDLSAWLGKVMGRRAWRVRPSTHAASGWVFVGLFGRNQFLIAAMFAAYGAARSGKAVKVRRYDAGFAVPVPLQEVPPEAYGGPGGEVLPGYTTAGVPAIPCKKHVPVNARNAAAEAAGVDR